jgi:hypothetical protein
VVVNREIAIEGEKKGGGGYKTDGRGKGKYTTGKMEGRVHRVEDGRESRKLQRRDDGRKGIQRVEDGNWTVRRVEVEGGFTTDGSMEVERKITTNGWTVEGVVTKQTVVERESTTEGRWKVGYHGWKMKEKVGNYNGGTMEGEGIPGGRWKGKVQRGGSGRGVYNGWKYGSGKEKYDEGTVEGVFTTDGRGKGKYNGRTMER